MVAETDGAPPEVLAAYGLTSATLEPVAIGLINRTWFVDPVAGDRVVLQRLSPIFGSEVNADLDVVTAHLAAQGLETPRLVRTQNDAQYLEHDGATWRVLTYIEGTTYTRLTASDQAEAAGHLLGRFHAALENLDYEPVHVRLGIHDTEKHLAGLKTALETHRNHARYDVVAPLGEAVLQFAEDLEPLPVDTLPTRFVHGDPKISNLLFYPDTHRARCWVDLDTIGKMPIPVELGDAIRSWCNSAGEDDPTARFDLDLFSAAIRGYAVGGALSEAEQNALVLGVLTISNELAARFAKDALEESYFGWDATRFSSRSHHNEVRAKGQLDLARSILQARSDAEAVVRRAFDGHTG